MKNTVLFIFLVIIFSPFTASASADSESTVIIHNDVNSSNTTTSSSHCQTSVHMETNGQVQDYNSSNCDSVNMQSNDGHSTVNINNGSNVTVVSSPSPTLIPITITPIATIDAQKIKDKIALKIQEQKKEMQIQHETIWQRIKDFLKNLFSFPLFFINTARFG